MIDNVDLAAKQLSEDSTVHRQVVSITQDIIHSGRIHNPKHILPPLFF